jgi:uncharacterized Zn-binding protein involved in type VI secretion
LSSNVKGKIGKLLTMPAICREGDPLSTGHACTGSTTIDTCGNDGTVSAEGSKVIVVGAPTVSHPHPPAPPCPPHVANLNAGSSSVSINGIPVGRVGDSADAGSMTGGAGTVFAG